MGATYAATPDCTKICLVVVISVIWDYLLFHADVTNAFGKAPPPKQTYYMRAAEEFVEWWNNWHPLLPIDLTYAVLVMRNLQGHPKGP